MVKNTIVHASINPGNAKKLQKTIHIAKYKYKKREKVNTSILLSPPMFSKESILADIASHSYSVCCHAAFIGGKLLRSCMLEYH
jgi:hypothetical protein